jgi:hypothetical protein
MRSKSERVRSGKRIRWIRERERERAIGERVQRDREIGREGAEPRSSDRWTREPRELRSSMIGGAAGTEIRQWRSFDREAVMSVRPVTRQIRECNPILRWWTPGEPEADFRLVKVFSGLTPKTRSPVTQNSTL